jgi:hypothetical protein
MGYYKMKVMVLTVIMLMVISNTFAWERTGHHIIAEIAAPIMNQATKNNFQNYLGN